MYKLKLVLGILFLSCISFSLNAQTVNDTSSVEKQSIADAANSMRAFGAQQQKATTQYVVAIVCNALSGIIAISSNNTDNLTPVALLSGIGSIFGIAGFVNDRASYRHMYDASNHLFDSVGY